MCLCKMLLLFLRHKSIPLLTSQQSKLSMRSRCNRQCLLLHRKCCFEQKIEKITLKKWRNMPLIVITGLPRSGKSSRAKELEQYFTDNGKGPVHIVSEADCIARSGYGVKESFTDTTKEKQIRASLKSEAMKLLTKTSLVILDGTNYIKGYRYEIFCMSKNARTTQCTLHCAMTVEQRDARRNEIVQSLTTSGSDLDVDTFDALCQRYEEPQDSSRWDRPLFTVYGEETLNLIQINSALYDQAPLPPNLATQNMPLSATNFLFELDKTTQTIIDQIASARKIGLDGPVEIPQAGMRAEVPSSMSVAQLNRHRRQFLNYVKMHTNVSSDISKIPAIFVQFLNTNTNGA